MEAQAADLKRLKAVRKPVRTSTTNAVNHLENLLKATTLNEDDIEDQLQMLDLKETHLETLNNQIMELTPDDDTELKAEGDSQEKYRSAITTVKIAAKRSLKRAGIILGHSSGSGSQIDLPNAINATLHSKLPPLVLQKFSGDVTEWTGFWSQFETTVDSKTTLSKVQKFIYLKSYLEKDALKVLAGMKPSEDNYNEAIKMLKARFGRDDLVAHAHMKKLLALEPVRSSGDLVALRRFYDACEVNIRSLRSLGVDTAVNGTFLCPKLLGCMPRDIRLEYTKERGTAASWDVDALVEFLREQLESRETCDMLGEMPQAPKNELRHESWSYERGRQKPQRYEQNRSRYGNSSAAVFNAAVKTRNIFCIFCKSTSHATSNCTDHTLEEKKKMITGENRCAVCTRFGHDTRNCNSYYNSCKLCKKKHNVAICEQNEANKPKRSNNGEQAGEETHPTEAPKNIEVGAHAVTCGKTVLLQTAFALVANPVNGVGEEARCLLDTGSQASFIKEEISKRLRLPVVGKRMIEVRSFGSDTPKEAVRNLVKITLANTEKTDDVIEITAIEVPYVCEAVTPVHCEDIKKKMERKGLQIADKSNTNTPQSSSIGILIGGDSYWEFATGRSERFGRALMAIETTLGWVIQGPSDQENIAIRTYAVSVMNISIEEKLISTTLQSFWDLESMGVQEKENSDPTATEVLEKFESETTLKNGRYSVTFPWKTNKEKLPDNLTVATKRMEGLVRRFNRDPELYKDYKAVIEDQMRQEIVEEVSKPEECPAGTYYLPHQPVKRETSATTKLRVVFDASSHVHGAPSLNDCLDSGPNLNPDLLNLLLQFRCHKIALTADIAKAFLQVSLEPKERDAVRFLWTKEDKNGKINEKEFRVFKMSRVPFGVTSSPFLLAATIKTHIRKYQVSEPEIYEVLDQNIYVDDLASGKDDVAGAYKLSVKASSILKDASMELRKWQTNNAELRNKWAEDRKNPNAKVKIDGAVEPTTQKILGLVWNPETDTLAVDLKNLVSVVQTNDNTKRFVLSTVAQIFDPVGILSPYVIKAKFIFQALWELGLGWDETLPEELSRQFHKWCEEMQEFASCTIKRCYFDLKDIIIEKELHCFSDASIKAYAAIVYVRYVTKDGQIKVSFVTSKTRVAPLKKITLPRLELMGCLLGSRLVKTVKNLFKEDIGIRMWTDSKIAYHWIKGPSKGWKPFVQNRVVEIQQLVDPQSWAHCPGSQNPADIPTRGATPNEMKEKSLWFGGPEWLKQEKSEWPLEKGGMEGVKIEDLEKRKVEALTAQVKVKSNIHHIVCLERYSSINKACRIAANVFRFVNKMKRKPVETGPITAKEMLEMETRFIKDLQREDYAREMTALKEKKCIPKDSDISTLKPLLNEQGLLCVGGRLEESNLSYQLKHPIIMKKSHYLSWLLMTRSHEEVLHSGIQATATQSREKYWIIAGRQLARNVVKHCYKCKRSNAKSCQEDTGLLPKDRVVEAEPFSVVGIDYAGPLSVKNDKTEEKCYICLITCATTRALHLELVPSLTTYEFLMAFRRMIARRGIPSVVYSDNAKTFKRADKDLKKIWESINCDQVRQFFGNKGITWKFIVEKAPWAGGFYERMVKSTKLILRKTLGKALLTYQELETVVIETEAVINARPITYVFNDASEPEPLSPSTLLIGKRVTRLPVQVAEDAQMPKYQSDFAKRLRYRVTIMQRLFKRWREEYLLELRTAHHINLAKKNTKIKLGDVMIVHEEKVPKHNWKLGVVTEVMEGRDGKVRSCIVRMGNNTVLRRPVQLLYALEINENDTVN